MDGVQFEAAKVERLGRGWRVSIPTAGGGALEYEYRTRRAARYHAAIFKLKPTWLPPPARVVRSPVGAGA